MCTWERDEVLEISLAEAAHQSVGASYKNVVASYSHTIGTACLKKTHTQNNSLEKNCKNSFPCNFSIKNFWFDRSVLF